MATIVDQITIVVRRFNMLKDEIVLVNSVTGWDGDKWKAIGLKPDALVRVIDTSIKELLRETDEWIDPTYNIELLYFIKELRGLTAFWIHGDSINLDTNKYYGGDIVEVQWNSALGYNSETGAVFL